VGVAASAVLAEGTPLPSSPARGEVPGSACGRTTQTPMVRTFHG
jgi:hypothetical protein